jgi:phosphatidylglycerophosphatase A
MRHSLKKYGLSAIHKAKSAPITVPFSWYTIVATWFYVGRIRICPGTLGSLATFPLFYFILSISHNMADIQYFSGLMLVGLFFLGWWAVHVFERVTQSHDHSCVVIDEVVGMLLVITLAFKEAYQTVMVLYPLLQLSPSIAAFGLILLIFRYFDIRKPFFIKYIDKAMKNSLSVLLDDMAAALFAVGVLKVVGLVVERII